MTNIQEFLGRLSKVRQSGPGIWNACCPAHEDKSPSLSIKLLQDGRVLIHCHAGCGGAEVMAAVGMSLSDLYPEPLDREFSPNWHMRQAKKKNDHERLVLACASGARASGERLNAAQKREELKAFMKLRNAVK